MKVGVQEEEERALFKEHNTHGRDKEFNEVRGVQRTSTVPLL